MARIFVGNLPIDIKEREIEDIFDRYGKIRDIDIKCPSRPPAFAFITFDHYRDAEDAIAGEDGQKFDGLRLRVEMSKGSRGSDDRYSGGRFSDDRRDRDRDRRPVGGGRRTDFGVIVTNLPRRCSWQDLKDFMRKAGDVVFADIDSYGDGVVEFSNREDMERAVDKLDGELFRGAYAESEVRVKLANKSRGESRDRDRRRSPSRSRSRSVDRDDDRDRKPVRDEDDEDRDRDRDRDRKPSGGDDDDYDKPRGSSSAAADEDD